MEWSQRRKVYFTFGFIAILLFFFVLPSYFIFRKLPTCFDKKQNSDEIGVDCGGSCALYCAAQIKPLRIVWAKAFEFAPEHYDVGAYIENPNPDAGIRSAPYTVRIFDSAGQKIAERSALTPIAPGSAILLFEGNFTLVAEPEKVEIDFGGNYLATWTKASPARSTLVTKNQTIKYTDMGPRLDAVVVNTDYVNSAGKIILGAVILDATRKPIAISRTYVDEIGKGSEQNVFFTWPNPFSGTNEGGKLITDIIIMRPAVFEE